VRSGPSERAGGSRRGSATAALTRLEQTRAGDPAFESDATFSAAVAAVTSAFGDTTRREIYLFITEQEGVTAAEVGRHFALHPNVARHHLDKLAAGGYLDVSIEHPGAGAGRPSKRYRRSALPAPVPMPPRPDTLVVNLLVRALALIEPERAEQIALEVGEEYGHSLAAQMAPGDSQRSMRAAMSAVADALTAHGFAAHAEERDDSTSVVRDCCPFGALVIEHPVLCAVDRGMVQGLLEGLCKDSVPVLMSSRALGDATCASVAG
jgi:predicted ArsR family transcriptional regulator